MDKKSAWVFGDFIQGGRKITRCRKPQECWTCNRAIQPGERYVRTWPKAKEIDGVLMSEYGVLMSEFDYEATCLECCPADERALASEKKLDGCQ